MNLKNLVTYCVVGCLIFVLGAVFAPMQAQAATSALPPRPTLVTPTVPALVVSSSNGASIQLSVKAANSWALWTEVQWQDALGGWHTVDGWRGGLDSISSGVGLKTWWVAPTDFSKGPFRWQVYRGKGDSLLATSTTFNLPTANRTTVAVSVTLTP